MRRRVFDRDGREWTVRRCLAPWWRVVQPINVFTDRYQSRDVELPLPTKPARRRGDRRTIASQGERIARRIVDLPFMILRRVGMAVILFPAASLELLAQGLVGAALWVLRSMGVVRHRVEIVGHTGHRIHSVTVLLVPGNSGAVDELVDDLAADRHDADKPYRPKDLPASVEVRSHNSAWHTRKPPKRLSLDHPKSPPYGTTESHVAAGGSIWRKRST